jgi:hypothetical protein
VSKGAEARAAEEKRRSEAGEEVIKKDPPRGNRGTATLSGRAKSLGLWHSRQTTGQT